jgi:hypothetical protein
MPPPGTPARPPACRFHASVRTESCVNAEIRASWALLALVGSEQCRPVNDCAWSPTAVGRVDIRLIAEEGVAGA